MKNINLRVKPDLTVNVSAAPEVSMERIESFVASQSVFILRALEKYEKAADTKKEYTDGGEVRSLGRPYKLSLKTGEEYDVSGKTDGDIMYVTAPDNETAEHIITRLLNERLADYIGEAMPRIYALISPLGVPVPQVKIKFMKSCWGSCIPAKKRVAFSTMLREYPTEAIDYVILHELAHFLHQDHSKDFYAVIERFMPDWKRRKAMLKESVPNI